MPTSADPDVLVDTSAAVALVVVDHEHHDVVSRTLDGMTLGLAGHAAFETFSALSRLPPPLRRTPAAVTRLLSARFPSSRFLEPADQAALLDRLPDLPVAGGQVYDALVGLAAVTWATPLATRDRRALDTYRILEVDVRFIA